MNTTAKPAGPNPFENPSHCPVSTACSKEMVLVMRENGLPDIHHTDIEFFYRPDIEKYQASVCHGGVLLFIIAVDEDEVSCLERTEQWKLEHKKIWPVVKIETPAYYSVT